MTGSNPGEKKLPDNVVPIRPDLEIHEVQMTDDGLLMDDSCRGFRWRPIFWKRFWEER